MTRDASAPDARMSLSGLARRDPEESALDQCGSRFADPSKAAFKWPFTAPDSKQNVLAPEKIHQDKRAVPAADKPVGSRSNIYISFPRKFSENLTLVLGNGNFERLLSKIAIFCQAKRTFLELDT